MERFLILCLAHISAGAGDGKLLALAVAGCACGVYLFFRGFRILQRKRLIENTPTSKIHGAAMGLVEVNGLATGPHTIPAPVTGLPCYYYRSVAWQLEKSGKNEHWEKVADESLHVPFYIDDNTGTLLVDPQGAEMDIHRDFSETYNNSLFSTPGVPAGVAGFLGRYGIDCDKKTKVEEFCIKPKNCLFILGTLSQNHGVDVNAIPVRSVVTNLPKIAQGGPLFSFQPVLSNSRNSTSVTGATPSQSPDKLASVLLKAGITSPAAWAAAGVSNMAGVARPLSTTAGTGGGAAVGTAPQAFDFHPATVLMKGVRNPVFYISWRSQRDIVQSMGWKCSLMIWGGPALTVLSAYVLSSYFGWF